MTTVTLKTPIEFEGTPIEKIDMDLDSLKGFDMKECAKQARRTMTERGEVAMAIEVENDFTIAVAARAAKKPTELFDQLSMPDYIAVLSTVRSFLFSGQ